MERYHIIKKMRKLLADIGTHLQNNNMSEDQLKNSISELEKLVSILMKETEKKSVPYNLIIKVNRFLDALKHHYGIKETNNGEILKMTDLKGFLHGELGIPMPKEDNYISYDKKGTPLNMLLI